MVAPTKCLNNNDSHKLSPFEYQATYNLKQTLCANLLLLPAEKQLIIHFINAIINKINVDIIDAIFENYSRPWHPRVLLFVLPFRNLHFDQYQQYSTRRRNFFGLA